MGWPQIVWVVLAGMSIGISISQHGKPKTGNNNFFITMIVVGIHVFLLSSGGFFSGIGS